MDDVLAGFPVFQASYPYAEFFRVLNGRTYSLNISNSKQLVFGVVPYKLTKKLRCPTDVMTSDFDVVLKIVDPKYSTSVSIFGAEFDKFFDSLDSAVHVFKRGIAVETDFYVMKDTKDGYFEFNLKEDGKKVFKIHRSSVEQVLAMRKTVELYVESLKYTNYLKDFMDVVDLIIKFESRMNIKIENSEILLENTHIFKGTPKELLYYDICFSFPKTLCHILNHIKTMCTQPKD